MVMRNPTAPERGQNRSSAGSHVYDLRTGFPLLTTKKLHTRSIIHELIWFLRGDTNIAYLKENASVSGMNGLMKTVILGLSTASSGGAGRLLMASKSIRSPMLSK